MDKTEKFFYLPQATNATCLPPPVRRPVLHSGAA